MYMNEILDAVKAEMIKSLKEYGPMPTTFHGLAVAWEEWREFVQAVSDKDEITVIEEGIQAAAMILSVLRDCTKDHVFRDGKIWDRETYTDLCRTQYGKEDISGEHSKVQEGFAGIFSELKARSVEESQYRDGDRKDVHPDAGKRTEPKTKEGLDG